MMKRLTVHFSGRVQGVGFRFTAERLARQFEVTGYVRNLEDGRVEIAAEGEEAVLQDFLAAVSESRMKPHIRDREVGWFKAEGLWTAFRILC